MHQKTLVLHGSYSKFYTKANGGIPLGNPSGSRSFRRLRHSWSEQRSGIGNRESDQISDRRLVPGVMYGWTHVSPMPDTRFGFG
ncbi:Riboflavin kinase / FAD synthetase domain containing protein [Anopheles sinensis]|uniref:Riboflavin kinase / FAD synthetase domain containing protein n=1 Tax=Anopheles sinensis TaxID=74873 RepID=A0A084VRB5_ANOSI|nr:Riboflavin kinase / FAD synthetase domain containing protein [Anopheles sinensis]